MLDFRGGAILILLAVVLVLPEANADDGLQCSIPGQCVDSDLIYEGNEKTKQDCHDSCKNKEDCSWFTYRYTENFCLLFSNCLNITEVGCDSCITGEKDCSLYSCGIQGSCLGHFDHSEATDSEAKCLDSCLANSDCKWYTFDRGNKLCLQFESCPSINEECIDCVSGERDCTIDRPMTKLLVTTGVSGRQSTNITEIIDLDNPDSNCDDYLPYPTPEGTAYAMAGLLANGKPLICDGLNSDSCYYLGNSTAQVETKEYRKSGKAIVTNNGDGGGSGLWLLGGGWSNTTEFVTPGNPSVYGPELPYRDYIYGYCLVQLDTDTFMMLGGLTNNQVITDTLFIHVKNQTFTPGPQLTGKNTEMSCGVIELLGSSSKKVVVVAGGLYGSGKQIETWTVGSTANEFTKINATLPRGLYQAAEVVTADRKSLVISGGWSGDYQDALLRITCNSSSIDCNVEEMAQRLRIPRRDHVAMLVPDSLVNCH